MSEQCKAVHPNSPEPGIFICCYELGHAGRHYTYNIVGKNYYWEDSDYTETSRQKVPYPEA